MEPPLPGPCRLEAEEVEGRHFGEASCREYRQSLLHVLPHAWASRHDTRLVEAFFERHKEGQGAQKAALAMAARTPKGKLPAYLLLRACGCQMARPGSAAC